MQNGQFCAGWFADNFGSRFAPRLVEHIELAAIAVGIGMVIALAAALLAHRQGWFETPFSLLSAFLYTIPALAFFELMVQVTGINRFTAEIALVSYTLLILFRNTLAGLRAVPPDALEAAQAMGPSRRQTLLRVELPLALPPIMAGLRIATVTTISLATVAAYIGAGGLGEPIFDGIQTGTLAHLAISFASIGVALAIAIPLGIWLGHLHRGSFLAINVSNVFRALPSLAMISIGIGFLGIGFLGIGFANVLVALVVLAAP